MDQRRKHRKFGRGGMTSYHNNIQMGSFYQVDDAYLVYGNGTGGKPKEREKKTL